MVDILKLFVGLAIFLIWYIMSKNRGEKEPTSALWAAGAFGFVGLIIAVILEWKMLPTALLETGALHGQELMRTALYIGIVEELSKFLPLALFIYKKGYFNEYNDGVLYFALAGLAFGVPENILYTLGGGLVVGVVRLVMTPFFHAATTALVGYMLVRTKIGHSNIAGLVLTLLTVVCLHAGYDYGLMKGSWSMALMSLGISVTLTMSLFIVVRLAVRRDEQLARERTMNIPQ